MLKKILSLTSNAASGRLGSYYSWRDFHGPRLRQLLSSYEFSNIQIEVFYVFLKFGQFTYAATKSYDDTFEPYSGYSFASVPLKSVPFRDSEVDLDSVISFYRCPKSKRFVIFVMSRESEVHFESPSKIKVVEARNFAERTMEERNLPTSYLSQKFSIALDVFSPRMKCSEVCNSLTSSATSWETEISHFNKKLPPATEENLKILKQYFLTESSEIRYSDTYLWLDQ